jgi:hypothetical protein
MSSFDPDKILEDRARRAEELLEAAWVEDELRYWESTRIRCPECGGAGCVLCQYLGKVDLSLAWTIIDSIEAGSHAQWARNFWATTLPAK